MMAPVFFSSSENIIEFPSCFGAIILDISSRIYTLN
jgi:hypothetical protein